MIHDRQETAPLPVSDSSGEVGQADDVAVDQEPAPRPAGGQGKALTFARELIETILLTLIIFVAVRTLVVNYRVDGESMRPNLQNGEYLLVNKAVYFHVDLNAIKDLVPGQHHTGRDVVYLFHPPQRGDIIVLDPPVRSDKPYVKRVIALPGETVAIHDGQVFVNGVALAEPYIADPPHYPYPLGVNGASELTVPPGTIFVLGDNRNNSSDSHVFGPVSLDSVIGKAIVSYWPPDDIGLIPHERYTQSADGQ